MRLAAAIVLMLSALVLRADELEEIIHEPPVTPVVPAAAVVSLESIAPPVINADLPPVSVGALLAALADPVMTPEAMTALVDQLTPDQASSVIVELLQRPDDLKALVARLKTDRLMSAKVALFIADIEAWAKASEFLMADNKKPVVGNWLEEAKAKLRRKLVSRGYTPETLAEVEALMKRVERPAERKGLDKLNLK